VPCLPHKSSLTPQQSATGFAHRDRVAICPLACHARRFSRLQHLVALLPPLQALHAPLVHLLLHLRESLALFLGRALGLDRIDSPLYHISFSTPHQVAQKRTCRSVSFSSLSSFSLALTAASAFLSTTRLSHVVWLARGRKAALLSCHCLPVQNQSVCETLYGSNMGVRTILLHSLDGAHCIHSRRLGYYRFRHVGSVVLLRDFARPEDLERPAKKSPADIDSSPALACFGLREQRQATSEGSDQIRLCHRGSGLPLRLLFVTQ
jgi:hypothetical protein